MARKTTKKVTPSRRWPDILQARLRRLRKQFADEGVDAMLVSHPADIQYLTGFGGEDSWALVTRRSVVIISDRRFEEELNVHHRYCRTVMRTGPIADALAPVVKDGGIEKLGIQAEHLSVAARGALAKKVGARHLRETLGLLLDQRAIKDGDEVKLIRKAVQIQQRAFTQLLTELQPGQTEQQVCARLEFLMRDLGADDVSFKTIIAADANSSVPHYRPGRAKLRRNGIVLIDFGAQYRGYCSDMTRVVALGKMPPQIREIYEIVRDAQQAGIEAIAPGVPLADVDGAARQVIVDAGYGEQFGHGLGHGIGLEVHESPRLGTRAEGVLEPGHVVTVEPGIYLPGVGGVRIEDDVLVTAQGRRNLCSLPTDADSAII